MAAPPPPRPAPPRPAPPRPAVPCLWLGCPSLPRTRVEAWLRLAEAGPSPREPTVPEGGLGGPRGPRGLSPTARWVSRPCSGTPRGIRGPWHPSRGVPRRRRRRRRRRARRSRYQRPPPPAPPPRPLLYPPRLRPPPESERHALQGGRDRGCSGSEGPLAGRPPHPVSRLHGGGRTQRLPRRWRSCSAEAQRPGKRWGLGEGRRAGRRTGRRSWSRWWGARGAGWGGGGSLPGVGRRVGRGGTTATARN